MNQFQPLTESHAGCSGWEAIQPQHRLVQLEVAFLQVEAIESGTQSSQRQSLLRPEAELVLAAGDVLMHLRSRKAVQDTLTAIRRALTLLPDIAEDTPNEVINAFNKAIFWENQQDPQQNVVAGGRWSGTARSGGRPAIRAGRAGRPAPPVRSGIPGLRARGCGSTGSAGSPGRC